MNETYIHNTSQFMLPSVLFITSEPRAELLFIFIIRTFSFSDFSSIIFHIYHVLWGNVCISCHVVITQIIYSNAQSQFLFSSQIVFFWGWFFSVLGLKKKISLKLY